MPRPYLVPGPTICVGSHQQGIACSSFPRMNWAGAGLHAGGPLLLLPSTVVHPSSPSRGCYLSSWLAPPLPALLPVLQLAPLLAMLLALLLAPLLLAEPRSPPSRSPVPWR